MVRPRRAGPGWRAPRWRWAPPRPCSARLTPPIAPPQASRDDRAGPADEEELAQLDDYVPVADDAAPAPSQDVTEDDDGPADEEEGEDLLENMHKCGGCGGGGAAGAAGRGGRQGARSGAPAPARGSALVRAAAGQCGPRRWRTAAIPAPTPPLTTTPSPPPPSPLPTPLQ
jgi:hypothetical protein